MEFEIRRENYIFLFFLISQLAFSSYPFFPQKEFVEKGNVSQDMLKETPLKIYKQAEVGASDILIAIGLSDSYCNI